MEKGRGKQARRIEWITFAFALIVCLIAGWKIYRPRMGEETVAVITVDGKELERTPCHKRKIKPFPYREKQENLFPLKSRIRPSVLSR